ncbi:MAG: hypothetical protein Q8936_21575 [Bacillota bacterium]|nr:hypothetical protein [Bacillota bacterium]
MDNISRYKILLEDILERELIKSDGLSENEIEKSVNNLNIRIPKALEDYYISAGNINEINEYHNIIYRPEELRLTTGKLIFAEENQQVCFWGIDLRDLGLEDPLVYQGQIDENEIFEWYSEDMKLTQFIIEMLRWEFFEME